MNRRKTTLYSYSFGKFVDGVKEEISRFKYVSIDSIVDFYRCSYDVMVWYDHTTVSLGRNTGE